MKLIALYEQVCNSYNESLHIVVQRFSPNAFNGHFTDQELITVYLFCTIYEERFEHKQMWRFIKRYWGDWFPQLPSYQTFNKRLNRLVPAFEFWINLLISDCVFDADLKKIYLGDSCPIQTCAGNRPGKVAPELTDKTWSPTKKKWYWGCKLHILAQKRRGKLPIPQIVGFSSAEEHDLSVMRDFLEQQGYTAFFLDKAYVSEPLSEQMESNDNEYFTPEKKVKGQSTEQRQRDYATQKQIASDTAKHRQPVESLFNWLNEKTGIQNAAKVRSSKGLQLHIYGKLLAGLGLLLEIF